VRAGKVKARGSRVLSIKELLALLHQGSSHLGSSSLLNQGKEVREEGKVM
jgi:hypothetical protein